MNWSLEYKKAAKWSGYTLLVGLVISAAVALLIRDNNSTKINKALQSASEQISHNVLERITLYQYGLRGARGMIVTAGENEVTREAFIRYSLTRDVDKEFPGARGFGFIRRVSPKEEPSFIAQAQQDGWPDFAIRQLSAHNDERYVIQYIEPVERNRSAVGLDIGSEKHRRDAATAALLSGEVRLTGPITLVQVTGKPLQSFLILMPIYRSGSTPSTIEARKAEGFGWSYAPLVTNEVLAGLELTLQTTKLNLIDVTQADDPINFFETHEADSRPLSHFKHIVNEEIFGRKWQFEVIAYPEFITGLHLNRPSLIFLYGVMFSVLLAALVMMWSLNLQRKQQVLAEQARRASMLEHSLDGIISYDLEGRITSWNRGAELLFGYKESEVLGLLSTELIVPPTEVEIETAWFKRVFAGETILNQISHHQSQDGQILSTAMTAVPIIDEHGDVEGLSQTIRDITLQQDAERRILKLNESLELKVAERTIELQQAVSENKALLKSINDQLLYSVTDADGVILEVNDYFCRMSGYSREQLVGQNSSLLSSGEHDAAFWKAMWAKIKAGQSWHGEICNRDKQGRIHWFDTVIGPITDDDGGVERFVALSTDISERKFAQIEKNKLGSLLSYVLDSASEISIIATDNDGVITLFNRGAENLLGYDAKELVGISTPAPLHLADEVQERSLELSQQSGLTIEGFDTFVYMPKTQGPETRNWTYVRKDGSHCQVSLSVTAMYDDNGNLIGYLGIAIDITQALQQREALITASSHLSKAAEVAKLGIWTWNVQDNTLEWNDRMFAIYELPLSLRQDGLTYEHWLMRLHPDDMAMAEQKLNDAIAGKGEYDPVFRVLTAEGGQRYIQAGAEIEKDKQGNALRVIGINIDITEQRELEATLREAKKQADEASAAKSAFLANMSHEIRTPMNAVLGMLQLMQHTSMSTQQRDYITKTHVAAKSLLGLLNDILDFSKIEAGKLQLDLQPCEIEMLMRDLAVVLSGNLGNRDVEVMFSLDPAIPSWLLIDKLRLQQILINLAGNALKFTHRGQVIVDVECLQSEADKIKLRFAITDTGIGISEEQLGRIFTGFEQAESSTSRRFGGTGLGLAISKRLVELMGGELLVTSRVGEGSCFWFELLLESLPMPATSNIDIRGCRVLVVDDNQITTEILRKILSDFGCLVECVYSGSEAIERCKQQGSDQQPFDIVLMDWSMPELNGLDAAKLLRDTAEAQQRKVPAVIMLTAYGEDVVMLENEDSSPPFVHFLTKPVTSQLLAESISQVLTGQVMDRPVKLSSPKRLQGLTILVVEDNQLNRQVVDELLTLEGAKVVLAEGGGEGVGAVTQSGQPFDIVIMDVQMPDMDGLEATRRIRADSRFELLPILAMTANASHADRLECIAAGMNDHIGKPIDMQQLVPAILHLVGREPTDFSIAPVYELEQSVEVSEFKEPDEDAPLLEDYKQILKRFDGNKSFFEKMALGFESEIGKLLSQFKASIAAQDPVAMAANSHGIKGLASNFGAISLANFAAYLEKQFKQGTQESQQIEAWAAKLALLAQLSVEQLMSYLSEATSEAVVLSRGVDDLSQDTQAANEQIRLLKELLQQNNLDAVALVDEITGPFTSHVLWQELHAQVHGLDFGQALVKLDIIEQEVI
ncbi:PAS domain S-box protein [Shewanella psychrotolerans]|uniref:PAS domain S-box protein n=1 Tax=Shewanella psychrotolerans TaxID=2864206 RepID=UPI001C65B5A8|nr:PAS domain S-box protein [Shewanella psychrotolerans]QYK01254.1 PAS domain S-box protein [Shewanella psychrotolerans]